ncbi:MAG: GxxExxY protein [Candidatus Berkelbacteria bacterium]|nr:GxxExxY protein [Candidatus Berkelbacteria bacterium]
MADLIHKELSYKIVDLAFEVFNSLGAGLKEKNYADAFEILLKDENISYVREIYYPLKIREKVVGRNYFDFFVENKIIVELKSGDRHYHEACTQLFQYLKISRVDLGIVIRFTNEGVKYKRIPNISD